MKLHPDIVIIDLVKFSKLKNKKRWQNKKRLIRKFKKYYYRYLSESVINSWNLVCHATRAKNELLRQEDGNILAVLRKAAGSPNEKISYLQIKVNS